MRLGLRAAVAFGALAAASSAVAEEGMWTFDNLPSDRMREDIGWAPDQAWSDRVMAATARIPGCSASVVSGDGLVLTNHHCVIACIQSLSTTEENFLSLGFAARAREEERRCPGLSVQTLAGIADVTTRIEAAANGAAAEDFARRRDAEIARIESECARGMRCEVVTLYQGGRYALYRYRRFTDVRLVFAPEHAIAAFGGAADNFSFPRYSLDVSFLRVYENETPAATPTHVSLRFTPVIEGEVTFAAGNPGVTSRLRTVSELAFERDVALPWRLASLAAARARLSVYVAQGPEQARQASEALQTVENLFAAMSGRRLALADAEGFARIEAREADLRARVARNQAATRAVGAAWQEIETAQTAYRAMFLEHQHLEARAAERSLLFAWARDIVRAAAEREKPDAQRLRRYNAARLVGVGQFVMTPRPVDTEYETLNLSLWLNGLRDDLGGDHPSARRVLGGADPDVLARFLAQSRLADPGYRRELWEGGRAAVEASDDPMIVFVRSWDEEARRVFLRYQAQVEAPVARAQERIGRARFQAFGDAHYPDATFSPRLSYGRAEGWTEAAHFIGPFTRVRGLFERASGVAPFMLTPPWLEARDRLDSETIFNIATSHDLISGSSGSALLDRDARVVGVVFDGNIHSLGGEYFYDGESNRAVSVSSTAIRAALADVYGMSALVAELEGRAPAPIVATEAATIAP